MRPARLSLASFLLTTIPLVACTLDNTPSSSCDEYDTGSDCYSGYPYGGGSSSGDYGSGYDSGTSTGDPSSDCQNAFAVTFDAPATSGDCQLVVSPSDSTYDNAVYYFPTPPSDDASEPCEAFEGPVPGRCLRALGTIAFGSTSADDVVALQTALGISTSFTATLRCAHDASEPFKEVTITCVSPPKKDAGPVVDDDAGTSGNDASTDDASPGADAGCGP